ncbi:MAG: GTPase RsgA, partial [Planktomarina sp.]
MVRDYSQFLGETPVPQVALTPLERLGWQPHFAQQVDADGLTETPPARVTQVHRNRLHVVGDGIDTLIPSGLDATVGDWVLLDADHAQGTEVLDRKSLFERRAAGHDRRLQSIAANVDTVFIVSSCNRDFNIARLERYVVLAMEAQVTPVILLTKADLCDDPLEYARQAETISDRVAVVVLNALSTDPTEKLAPWVKPKQTVAFLGSSGVGKSTLVNALFNQTKAETAAIRENDA